MKGFVYGVWCSQHDKWFREKIVKTEDSELYVIPLLVLQDIKGFIYEFCRDQHGSRFIQQKLADAPSEELMAVYQEVEPHIIALMQDVFGNYVIQKCFEHGTKVRRLSCPLKPFLSGTGSRKLSAVGPL